MNRPDDTSKTIPNLIYDTRAEASPDAPIRGNTSRPTLVATDLSNPTARINRYPWRLESASDAEGQSSISPHGYVSDPQRSQQHSYGAYGEGEAYNTLSHEQQQQQQQQPAYIPSMQPYSARHAVTPIGSQIDILPQEYLAGRSGYSGAGLPAGSQMISSQGTYAPGAYITTMAPLEGNIHATYSDDTQDARPTNLQNPNLHSDQDQALSSIVATHRNQLLHAYQNIHDRNLKEAGEFILQASTTLLRNAAKLNLGLDIESTYNERLALFRDFNRCWLALGQMQIDLTEAAIKQKDEGGPTTIPENLLSLPVLEGMGHTLIELCDSVQRLGLVDYEMGVEEERILDIIIKSMDTLRRFSGTDASGGGRPDSWPSRTDAHLKSENPLGPNVEEGES